MTQQNSEQINQALALHQAGKLPEAEAIYRSILARDSRNARVHHLLGVLAFQVGQVDAAIELIQESIAIAPESAEAHGHLGVVLVAKGRLAEAVAAYRRSLALQPGAADVHNNLGNALVQAGQIDDATAAYRAALEIKSEFAEAHNNLGLALAHKGQYAHAADSYRQATRIRPQYEAWNNLGNAMYSQGNFSEAIASFERAIEIRADYPEAWNNLGNALRQAEKTEQASAAFERALSLRPDFAEAANNLGLVSFARGQLAEAIALYRKSIALRADFADAHYNLAIALRSAGEVKEAIDESRQAVACRPDFAEAHNNLGILLHDRGDLPGGIDAFGAAIASRPDYAEGHNNLGNALRQAGRVTEAIASYKKALTLRPQYAEAHNNLGSALQQAGRLVEAVSSYDKALELRPGLAEAHNNLGNAFKDQGELDEALACYARAVKLAPSDAAADSNRLYTLHFHPDYSPGEILREHLAWDRRHALPLSGLARPHENVPDPKRRLRIGYVSPYFRDHCQAMFTLPLLANHDRRQVEVFCYSDVACTDAVTARVKTFTDNWRDSVGMSDQELAEMVRRDGIDILVDLTVHMSHNRLLAFARRPAPVQVTWLGYPGTTGLGAMDYRLSDPYLDPLDQHDDFYAEQTIRLPDSFWCYDPLADGPAISQLPARKNGFITFGCLNNFCKVTEPTVKLWAQVLGGLPDSRMLVLAPRGPAREHLLEKFQRSGVAPTRIEFADRCPRHKYLELYQRIDIGLDTFPYNGHTTTLDGLWMGVPVVTVVGRSAVGRGGWSQLSNVGLRDLVARSYKQFTRVATGLAHDRDRLVSLRATLRERLVRSPLMDAPRFARNIEAAYRQMWQAWVGETLRPVAVPA